MSAPGPFLCAHAVRNSVDFAREVFRLIRTISPQDMQEMERAFLDGTGYPSLLLMEHAGPGRGGGRLRGG